jgi:WD40 repeat protein
LISITQKGVVYLIDYHKRKIVSKNDISGGKFALNAICWNKFDPEQILIGAMDGNCYLIKISPDKKTMDVVNTYQHPKRVFGVRWNPHNAKEFATCC